MKTLFVSFFLLFVSLPIRAQYSVVEGFPYILHNNQSNAKILDIGNNHLIFIMANDSLFISHSYDDGTTWQEPITVWSGELIQHLDGIILPTGRIVLEFAKYSIYSDDNGNTWSEPISIGGTRPSYKKKKLYYSNNLYAFFQWGSKLFYSYSDNNGTSWSSFSPVSNIAPFNIEDFSFINFSQGNYIVALMGNENGTYSIILKKTTSLSGEWTDFGTVFETTKQIVDIDGIKDSTGKYWISFTMVDTIGQREVKNVYYITSEDDGNTWSDPVLFARSFQDDWNIRLSISDNNPYAVFLTNRGDIQSLPYYGKLGISEDIHYSPFLQDFSTHIVDDYPNTVTVVATARAFTDQLPITVSLIYNGEPIETMYDDGQHNDGVAGDSIYGASHTFNYSEITETYNIGLRATDVNQNTTFLQLFPLYPPILSGWDFCILRNGNTKFAINSNGIIADIGPYTAQTTYDGVQVIYSAGFMMSGKANGEIWSNAMATSSRIRDYVSGTIGDTSTAVYVVKATDPPFGESWQNWSNAVAKGAYFYDGDGDGVYNPVDLNENGQWDWSEDCPDILGDVTAWAVYNDGVPAADRWFTDVPPQGIEIRQTVWTKYGEDYNKNVYYIRYSIVNRGTVADTLKDVYFGLWADNDLGDYTDDLAGCSIPTRSGYTYNDGGDVAFGLSVPVVMTTLLQGPIRYTGNPEDEATNNMGNLLGIQHINGAVNDTLTSFVHYMQSHPTQGDPGSKEQMRYYLLGLNQAGDVVDPCNWQFGVVLGEDCSMIDGHFMYSGDPVDSTGWINAFPTDQRQMLNTGPFDLIKDQPVDIIAAYHFSRGENNLESLTLGLTKAEALQNNFPILDVEDRNINNFAVEYELEQNYPNPFNPTTTIKFSIKKRSNVRLEIYNALGQRVAELLNQEMKAGKYKIKFDAQSVAGGLASGVYFYALHAGDFVKTRKMILLK